jgi:hypothetical protein
MLVDTTLIIATFGAAVVTVVLFRAAKADTAKSQLVGTMGRPLELVSLASDRIKRLRVLGSRLLRVVGITLALLVALGIVGAILFGVWKLIQFLLHASVTQYISVIAAFLSAAIVCLFLNSCCYKKSYSRYCPRYYEGRASFFYIEPTTRDVTYYGTGYLPNRVYAGDSQNISFSFSADFIGELERLYRCQSDKTATHVVLDLAIPPGDKAFLEVELLAAGIEVAGEVAQRQRLKSKDIHFNWNCHFKNSGKHSIAFVLRLVVENQSVTLGRVDHTIRVVRIDHLTQSQVWVITWLAGIIAGTLGVAEVLHKLGIW